MAHALQFVHVSKRYRLGTAGMSLRKAIAGLARRLGRPRAGRPAEGGNSFVALDDVSFGLEQGQILGLIGPNGAGKTTALKLIAGITLPSAGEVEVHGRVSSLIELGAGFHPDLTGRENIFLNAALLGLSRQEAAEKLDQIVAFSGLEPFLDTPVKRYSSGMYVRLGFAVAAHVEPDILLVDEVLAVGDAEFRLKCAARLQELRVAGVTVVLVSHNLYLAQSLCSQGLFLRAGRIAARGPIGDVVRDYEGWMRSNQLESAASFEGPGQAPAEGQPIHISQVSVAPRFGRNGAALKHSDAVEVKVAFLCQTRVEDAGVVLRFLRSDGATASMIRSREYGFELGALEGAGNICVRLRALQLAGGLYLAEAKLVGALDGVPLAEGRSDWFEVQGLSLSHDETYGVYVPDVESIRLERPEAS
ncbi:MAG: ABC transporter ATP-binding protein [Candidatus Promineifilaceae bacterium]